jgi:hypothetical protein
MSGCIIHHLRIRARRHNHSETNLLNSCGKLGAEALKRGSLFCIIDNFSENNFQYRLSVMVFLEKWP